MTRGTPTSPTFQDLIGLLPSGADPEPNWERIWNLWPELDELDACPQDPFHHGEGNVGLHTRMVLQALCEDEAWQNLPLERKSRIFWAAVLHDIGKPGTTRHEDGRITSRGHSSLGARIARQLLWKASVPFEWREQVCALISAHQAPFWLFEREDATRVAAELSWSCNTADLFLLARADARGRICEDQETLLEAVDLSAVLMGEAGCFGKPYPFANDESRIAAFTKPDRALDYAAHEAFSCTATLMCGLPGAGKDHWISEHAQGLPVISLDDMRRAAGIRHGDNQGQIIQAAREAAREHLRNGRDFIWNATNLTRSTRAMLLGLFRDYGARTQIVYVEAPASAQFGTRTNRTDDIPAKTLQSYIDKLEVPNRTEAHELRVVLQTAKLYT